ncbi:MAG: hypothetical protein M3P11_12020 [Actinomycetota bacterium]|nr:hypothetical protein [Actinomycetota bacterium]
MKLRSDDGQVLPLALAFLVFFGIVIAALLSFANASVLASERLREQRNTVYAADGATDAAIQYARGNAAVGAFGTPPFTAFSATLNGVTATVKCSSLANPTDVNRKVQFQTFVGAASTPTVVAIATYHDLAAGTPVDVTSWTYQK